MNHIITVSIISFVTGWVCSFLFNKYFKIDISIKMKDKSLTNSYNQNQREHLSDEIKNISILLNEIKQKGNLPIHVEPKILKSLKLIANTANWEKQLDKNTIENLNKIYNKWQRHINSDNQSVQKSGKDGGFVECKYWEGTEEEYAKALTNGEIDKNTKATIYSDHEYLTIDDNAQIKENMD